MSNQSAIIGYVRSGASVEEIGNVMILPDKEIIKIIKKYCHATNHSAIANSNNSYNLLHVVRAGDRTGSVRKKPKKVLSKKVE